MHVSCALNDSSKHICAKNLGGILSTVFWMNPFFGVEYAFVPERICGGTIVVTQMLPAPHPSANMAPKNILAGGTSPSPSSSSSKRKCPPKPKISKQWGGEGHFQSQNLYHRFGPLNRAFWAWNWKITNRFSENKGWGSEALWTFSENSSVLVDLTNVTLAFEYANSKLVEVVAVADVYAEKPVDDRWCRFGSWSLAIS